VPQPSDCRRAPTHQTFKTRRVDDTIEPCNRARDPETRAAYVRFAESGRDVVQSTQRRIPLDPYVHLSRARLRGHHPVFVGLRKELSSSVSA